MIIKININQEKGGIILGYSDDCPEVNLFTQAGKKPCCFINIDHGDGTLKRVQKCKYYKKASITGTKNNYTVECKRWK